MDPLPTELRNKLERTVVQARDVAEAGAKAALEALAVHHHEPYGHMSPEERKLRNHLRVKSRQLGGKQNRKSELEITHLVWECAYEHWHRMLFARFLAENDLLIEPEMGVAISLYECEELAKEEGKDLWALASEFAQRMLPQIFRPNDPVLRVMFASEHRLSLEKLLNDLEPAIFTASDSIGWVYQFWQSKRKKEVNQSGNKIGADELPAVTQLFTEPYMVSFLLDNSLGAWWATRRLTEADLQNAENEDELRKKVSIPGVPLEYLRFVKLANGSWTPAAGTFNGWPEHLSELKTLDPCCGSGHFLVAAFLMLVPMRMELEGLSARDACDAVLRENLHGLEIDKRCVEIAVFALALTAWRYPEAGGYRSLPGLNVACSGLTISAKKKDWLDLAGDNTNLCIALEELYKQFKDAPVLGSLINPEIGLAKGSLFEFKWEKIGPILTKALSGEKDDEKAEMGVVVRGLSKAAKLLSEYYNLVLTNVPYLARSKQDVRIKEFSEKYFKDAKNDLATVFILRCMELCAKGGTASLVLPQNWLFQATYKKLREHLLKKITWHITVKLGPGAFDTISGEVVKAVLWSSTKLSNTIENMLSGIDASFRKSAKKKTQFLVVGKVECVNQSKLHEAPDSRVVFNIADDSKLMQAHATSIQGLATSDDPQFTILFWELPNIFDGWVQLRGTVKNTAHYSGCERLMFWENGKGRYFNHAMALKEEGRLGGWKSGTEARNNKGVIVSQMSSIPVSIYSGEFYDHNACVILPTNEDELSAIWTYCSSPVFSNEVRKIDQSLKPSNNTFVKIPFNLEYWQKVAAKKYPDGLPEPYSDEPTQWIFHGHPAKSEYVLQVAIARLLGYRWPAELDSEMELSNEQREWVTKCDAFIEYADEDGIVCIPSMRGEEVASDRLSTFLNAVLGLDWSPSKERELIQATGTNTDNLDEWLRDHFFEQHCKLYHHRPFIWHIWDGRRRDGFHALVNYHKLAEGNGKGRQLLESLTYSYLGDWITRQKEGVKRGEGGAEDRLVAALELQKRLIAIIEGEPPFDIFVRWKPIEEQPIGWEPDINDGVRLNIRPFMVQDIPGGKKEAGILRWKPNIKWNKDRGKEPSRPKKQYPWFWKDGEFTGDRVNDIHLSINDKQKARKDTNEHEVV